MTFNELISICEPISISGPEPDTIGALTQDSREVEKGSVFIAIRGLQADGHDFMDQAISKGASVMISEKLLTSKKACVVQVDDTRSLVGPLAQAFEGYPAKKLKVIGITGTNGKTTVATLTYQALQKLGANPSMLGTVTKRIGDKEFKSRLTTADPIELASDMKKIVGAGSTHLVMEVSSHALDQQRVAGINFDIGVFTNLSHDHLDYHESLEAYARSKKQLFDNLHPGATAIVNGDDDQATTMTMDCRAKIVDFSFKKALKAECQVLSNTINGLVVRIGKIMIESSLVGAFNAYNITQAFLICRELGYNEKEIAEALEEAPGAPGRLERVEGSGQEGNPVILVDYAHTPDALKNVASTLSEIKKKNQTLHIVFGCGGNRDKSKRPKMARIAEKFGDKITVTSDNPRNENPDTIIEEIMAGFSEPRIVERITDRKEAITKAVLEGDFHTMILIAGKGHETYQEVAGERRNFDDRKVASDALIRRNNNSKNEVN